MVLGIEPLIYETGFGFGMQNKDMVLVTPTVASSCRTISIPTSSSSSGRVPQTSAASLSAAPHRSCSSARGGR